MNYSDEHKIIFLLPPRQGTRSIAGLLTGLNFKSAGDNPHGMSHEIKIPEGKEDYTIVCTIRNPYHRYLSCKNMILEWTLGNHPEYQGVDLNSFSEEDWQIKCIPFISDYWNILKLDKQYQIDYFVDTSNIEADLKKIPLFSLISEHPDYQFLWGDNIIRNKYNIAEKNGVKFSITEKEANFIYKKYQPIFDKFGYEKDSWK